MKNQHTSSSIKTDRTSDQVKPQPTMANICLDRHEVFPQSVIRETGMNMSGQITEENHQAYETVSIAQLKQVLPLHQSLYLPATAQLIYGGMDGGSSGAGAFLGPDGKWHVRLVSIFKDRRHWLLSVNENADFVNHMAELAGGRKNIIMAYERSRKNFKFGLNNTHVNGRNEEFWRVLLSLQKVQHCSVDPKTWQSLCLKGITGSDTKERAREYIRRRCPGTEWLDSYNKAPREAIVDAMCIALWCKDQHQAGGSVDWIRPSPAISEACTPA